MFSKVHFTLVFLLSAFFSNAQEVLNKQLLRADKHYIKGDYEEAVKDYLEYLQDFPKDYYASRQCARCYDRLNDHYNAIDHWPVVAESSEVTDNDYLDYAKCLLANNREADARRIFKHLSRSKNPVASAWGRSYLQPAFGIPDTNSIKIYELKNVNTSASEFSPLIFRDKLFFVLRDNPGAMEYTPRIPYIGHKLKVYIPKDSLSFLPSLLFEKLQAQEIQDQVSFTADGKWMFFSVKQALPEPGRNNRNKLITFQLYLLNLSSLNLPFPEIKVFEHNMSEFNTMHPSLSADGQRLYFSSNRMGSLGGMDIFYCNWNGNSWSKPVNAGDAVNTSGNEVFPHASPDSLLYFSSDQRPGLGGLDLFTAKPKSETEGFEPAQNCGAPFNSNSDDYGIFVLKGGKKGYFSSKRKTGVDEDLYFFSK